MHTSPTLVSHVLVAAGSSGGGKSGGSNYAYLVLIALFAVAYFAFLRPARNRQRAAMTAKRVADVGDEVTTTSGLIATVVAVADDMLTLEIAPGVQCRYVPAAILKVNMIDDDPDEDDSTAEHPLDASTHEVIDAPDESTDSGDGRDQPA